MRISETVDWNTVHTQVAATDFPLAIIDDFLERESLLSLGVELHSQEGWHQPEWGAEWFDLSSGYEHIVNPTVSGMTAFCRSFLALSGLPRSSKLKGVFAVRCNGSAGLLPHADNANFVLNLWTTPDRFNNVIGSGGMTVWDIKAPPEASPEQFTNAQWVQAFINEREGAKTLSIPYKWNRAILFDARLFHQSQSIDFVAADKTSMRTNLSFAFSS